MTKTIRSIYQSLSRSPVKSVLTLLTVGVGVGILIIAMSISFTLSDMMNAELETEGRVVMVANATIGDNGELEQVRPPEFDGDVTDLIAAEVAGVHGVSPLTPPFWTDFVADGKEYRIRSIFGTNEQYQNVSGLRLIAGSFFSAADVETGEKVAVLTESLATILFGSPVDAVGKTVKPPVSETAGVQQGGNQIRLRLPAAPTFTVVGVVEDPTELKRKSYGVADMVVPYTSLIPAGANIERFRGFLMSRLTVKVRSVSVASAEAQIRDVLQRAYGGDISVEIWEGTPNGETEYLAELRDSVSTFSLVVNLLGFFLLAAASIGILSIMVVEALGRSKEIALERALGASKTYIVREFFTRSVLISLVSAALGVALSVVFARPLGELVIPVFEGALSGQFASIIDIRSVVLSTAAALVIGGIFGALPVFSLFQGAIADSIREA